MIAHLKPQKFTQIDPAGKVVEKAINKPLKKHLDEIQITNNDIASYITSIEVAKQRQKEYQARLLTSRQRLKTLAKLPEPVLPDASILSLARLKAHKAVHHVSIDNGLLVMYFNPLFTDVRLKEGSRESRRRFLGCYRVTIGRDDKHFEALNLSFPMIRSHWGCSSSSVPCFGDWDQVGKLITGEPNMYGLAEVLVSYLTSTADGGAYRTSDSWISERNSNYLTRASTVYKGIRPDTLANFVGSDNDDNTTGGRDLRGTLCSVTSSDNGDRDKSINVRFLYNAGGWRCTPPALVPLSPLDPLLKSIGGLNLSNQKAWYEEFIKEEAPTIDPGAALLDYLDTMTQAEANSNYLLLAQKITIK